MVTTLNMTLLVRRDNFTEESKKSYVLQAGEPGYCTSSKVFKIGDGQHTWAELAFANKAEIEALIQVIDNKIAALGDTYATDEEVRVIKEALEDAIEANGTAIGGLELRVKAIEDAPYATKGQLDAVDAKFAAYKTAEAQKDIDDEQDRRIKALEDDRVTEEELTEAIKDFETKENVAKVAQDLADYESATDAALDARYTKTDADAKFETIANVDLVRANVTEITKDGGLIDAAKAAVVGTADDTKNANTVYGAKAYAKDLVDNIPAQIDYTVSCEDEEVAATDSTPAFKRHVLKQLDGTICTIDVPKDMVIADGRIEGDKLILVLNTGKEIEVAVGDLIEYVTGDTAADGVITVNIDPTTHVATATINDGTITSAKFADEVDEYVDGRIDDKIDAYNLATVAPIAAKVEGWDATKSTVDTNKTTWDLAGTAVQSADFETFKTANTKAIEDAAKAGTDAAAAVAEDLAEYIDGKSMSDAELKKYAEDKADAAQAAAKKVATDFNTAMDARVLKLEGNEAGYATTGEVATAKQEAIDAAKEYADGLEHKDTTYEIAATENALEFTVTPSVNGVAGAAETITLVAPTVNTGIMEVAAGNDIVVTPGADGKVTVAHETFTTGEYTRDPATSDRDGDQYFFTGVTVDNGHVTGANVKSLASVLEAMSFVFDGGNASN